MPDGTVNVNVKGTPEILIKTAMRFPDGRPRKVPIVHFVKDMIDFIEGEIVPEIARYSRR